MSYEPIDLRGNEQRAQDKALREQLAHENEVNDFLQIMSTPAGRRFVWRLMATCNVFQPIFRANSEMALLEGKRQVGLKLLTDINTLCPERYMQMVNEAKETK